MATIERKLTAVALRNPEPGRHWDGLGLYLEVTARGGQYWRMKYRHAGKESRLALGVYPEVSIAEARKRRDAARALLQAGVDPLDQRRVDRLDAERSRKGTVAAACADWFAFKRAGWAPETARKAEYVTRVYLLPKLGPRPIATLSSRECAQVLRPLAAHAPGLARKARQYLGGMIKYAIREGLREDGRLLMLDGALPTTETGHVPAATLPEEITAVLKAVHAYSQEVTRAALLLCAYTAQRPGVVVAMRWDELADDGKEWRIPAAKMKTRHAHIVPLPEQARALLETMRDYTAGREYVFPPLARQTTPHLHRDALSAALRRMGFAGQHATHGFRSMLRTAGRERLGIPADVLEAQLAHAKKGEVAQAYDRTAFTDERCKAMQAWADYLDHLREGGKVIPIHRKAQ